MNVKWKALSTHFAVWVMAEILLGGLGLDTIADYSEYLSRNQNIIARHFSNATIRFL